MVFHAGLGQRAVSPFFNAVHSRYTLRSSPRAISAPTGKARFDAHKAQLRRSEQVLRKFIFRPENLRPVPAWPSNGFLAIP